MAREQKNNKDDQALPSLALVFGYIAIKDLQRLEDRVRVLSQLGYGNQRYREFVTRLQGPSQS